MKKKISQDKVSDHSLSGEMVQAILKYLHEHPHASDTMEGIAEWWIMRQQVQVDLDILSRALQELIKTGVLVESTEGKTRRYSLTSSKDQLPS